MEEEAAGESKARGSRDLKSVVAVPERQARSGRAGSGNSRLFATALKDGGRRGQREAPSSSGSREQSRVQPSSSGSSSKVKVVVKKRKAAEEDEHGEREEEDRRDRPRRDDREERRDSDRKEAPRKKAPTFTITLDGMNPSAAQAAEPPRKKVLTMPASEVPTEAAGVAETEMAVAEGGEYRPKFVVKNGNNETAALKSMVESLQSMVQGLAAGQGGGYRGRGRGASRL
jgi:hypothetical protein